MNHPNRTFIARKIVLLISLFMITITSNICFGITNPIANVKTLMPSNSDEATHIKADTAIYNFKTGINVYQGHVLVLQGKSQLRADTITTYNLPNSQKIGKIVAIGNLAQYDTATSNKKLLHAQAKRIVYDVATNKVLLIGDGEIKQGGDTFSGPHIEYDLKQQAIISTPSNKMQTVINIGPSSLNQIKN